jgi:hypothetical protein
MYKISDYSFQKAKLLNVVIKPSKNKNKKIDVYKKNQIIASIGAKGYNDYPTYLEKKGKEYANERKRLYKIRHKNDIHTGNGYYANKILW